MDLENIDIEDKNSLTIINNISDQSLPLNLEVFMNMFMNGNVTKCKNNFKKVFERNQVTYQS